MDMHTFAYEDIKKGYWCRHRANNTLHNFFKQIQICFIFEAKYYKYGGDFWTLFSEPEIDNKKNNNNWIIKKNDVNKINLIWSNQFLLQILHHRQCFTESQYERKILISSIHITNKLVFIFY